jgi:hypothetical protein
MRPLHRQGCLPHAGGSRDRDDDHCSGDVIGGGEPVELGQLGNPAYEVGYRGGQLCRDLAGNSVNPRGWAVVVQTRVAAQHSLFKSAQLATRLYSELLNQDRPSLAVDLQCVGLTTGSVVREHQLGMQPLAERILGDQGNQLAGNGRMVAYLEVGLDSTLQRI